jgi:hypothetical protein
MSKNKIFYVTEGQFKALMEKKRKEKLVVAEMIEKISLQKARINESAELINEGIIDTLKNYVKKGLMTTAVIASLLASNQVNAQQLQAAGVPQHQIELASGGKNTQQTNQQIPLEKIEARLLKAMQRAGLKGTIAKYNQLTPQQKQNILTGIQSRIKSIDDVDKYNAITIGGWSKQQQSGDGVIQFDQQNQVKVTVDTSEAIVSVPLKKFFEKNSSQLANPEQLKDFVKNNLINFNHVDSIHISTSSSTLRNTGASEGKTWKQLSQERADAIVAAINGTEFDLGGQGVNEKQQVTTQMITINSNGQNGDGTSGPKSPFEVNPNVVAQYQQRGIDPSLWQSAATQAPLQNTAEYEQFQTADVTIHGKIVTTNTEDVPSYRYIVLSVRKDGGNLKVTGKTQKADISKCPVKFPVQKAK